METIKTKIDKIINKTGPLRVPSYWMNHLLNDIAADSENIKSELKDVENRVLNNYSYIRKIEGDVNALYPSGHYINGVAHLIAGKASEYTLEWSDSKGIDGSYLCEWSLEDNNDNLAYFISKSNLSCKIGGRATTEQVWITLQAKILRRLDLVEIVTASKQICIYPANAIITNASNYEVQKTLYSAGLVRNSDYTTSEEAALITAEQLQPGTTYSTSIFYKYNYHITHFEEFMYFTGVTNIPPYLFASCTDLKSIILPRSITVIKNNAFCRSNATYAPCSELLYIPSTVSTISYNSFVTINTVRNLYVDSVSWFLKSTLQLSSTSSTSLINLYLASFSDDGVLSGTKVTNLLVPSSITQIREGAFRNFDISTVRFHSGVTSIESGAFEGTPILELSLPDSLQSIGSKAFLNTCLLQQIYGNTNQNIYVSDSAFIETNPYVEFENFGPYGLFTVGNIGDYLLAKKSNNTWVYLTNSNPYVWTYGDHVFKAYKGWLFNDMSSEKTLTLSYTGAIEDLSDKLEFGYRIITINSNLTDAEFTLSYIDKTGIEIVQTVTAGEHTIMIGYGSAISITPVEVEGYSTPSPIIDATESYIFDFNYLEE